MFCSWPTPCFGAFRYQNSLNALAVALLTIRFGKTSGMVPSDGATNFSGSRRSLGGQVGQPGLVAPGEHRPAQVLAPGDRVEPGHRVGVRVVAGRHPRHQVVEVGAPVGVDDEVRRLGALQRDRRGRAPPRSGPSRRWWPRRSARCRRAGVSVRTSPSAISRSSDATWLPKLPSVWWFLPCTSAAIAPPMVTCRVPGSTGTHRPNGSSARISASRLTPACTVTVGGSPVGVDGEDPVQLGQVEGGAAGVLRGVAVAAAQPARHDPALRRRTCAARRRRRRPSRSRPDGTSVPDGPAPAVQLDQRLRDHRLRLRQRGRDGGHVVDVAHAEHRHRDHHEPDHPYSLQNMVVQHDVLGLPGVAGVDLQRVLQQSQGKRARSRWPSTGRRAGRPPSARGSRTPTGCRRSAPSPRPASR